MSTSGPLAGRADKRWEANRGRQRGRRRSDRETMRKTLWCRWACASVHWRLAPKSSSLILLDGSAPHAPTTIQATFPLLCRLHSQKTPHYMAPNLRLHRHRRRLRSVSWISWSLLAGSRVYFRSGSGRNKNGEQPKLFQRRLRWIMHVIMRSRKVTLKCGNNLGISLCKNVNGKCDTESL